jgi:hypothetical protein
MGLLGVTKNILVMFVSFKLQYPIFWLFIAFILWGCTPKKNKTDQEKILHAYANKFIDEENEYIYYKSQQEIDHFKKFISLPITKKRILEVTKPVGDLNLDSLITPETARVWNEKLGNYKSISWNQDVLRDIPFIKENEVPEFFYEGGFPTNNEKVVKIHFVGTPIVHRNVALVMYSARSSPLMGGIGYKIYGKINGQWQIIANDTVVWTN